MKCIIRSASTTLRPGHIVRVSDEEARRAVSTGTAVYTTKAAWKKQKALEEALKTN